MHLDNISAGASAAGSSDAQYNIGASTSSNGHFNGTGPAADVPMMVDDAGFDQRRPHVQMPHATRINFDKKSLSCEFDTRLLDPIDSKLTAADLIGQVDNVRLARRLELRFNQVVARLYEVQVALWHQCKDNQVLRAQIINLESACEAKKAEAERINKDYCQSLRRLHAFGENADAGVHPLVEQIVLLSDQCDENQREIKLLMATVAESNSERWRFLRLQRAEKDSLRERIRAFQCRVCLSRDVEIFYVACTCVVCYRCHMAKLANFCGACGKIRGEVVALKSWPRTPDMF